MKVIKRNIEKFTTRVTRSIQKRPEYYLWDWSQLDGDGQRFENFIAGHLFKAASIWNNPGLATVNVCYIKNRTGKEVDFLLTKDNKPWFLVEAKLAEDQISQNLRYFSNRPGVPGTQVILKPDVYRKDGNVCVISADLWLGYFA